MKITMLGCGGSTGVPLIGCDCAICKSNDPKNKRLRSSILVEENDTHILIDCSPDLRQQALNNNIRKIDAVLLTHAHADHIGGLDDLRSFNYLNNAPLPVYSNKQTLAEINIRYDYAFLPEIPKIWYRPSLIPHEITDAYKFEIGGMEIESFPQTHGKLTSLGFRFGDFAYSTDTNYIAPEILHSLKGAKLWIVDCLRYEKAPTHSDFQQTLEWIDIVRPKQAVLTHMGHDFEYHQLKNKLPSHISPGFDGMVIEL